MITWYTHKFWYLKAHSHLARIASPASSVANTQDQGSVEENLKADQIIPVLVLSESEINAGPEELGRTLQYFVDHDDVCSDDFTGILVMKPSTTGHDVAPESLAALRATFSSIYHLAGSLETFANDDSLPSGPYFLSGSNLHEAWRLYPDDLDAFTFGMIPAIIGEQEYLLPAQRSLNL